MFAKDSKGGKERKEDVPIKQPEDLCGDEKLCMFTYPCQNPGVVLQYSSAADITGGKLGKRIGDLSVFFPTSATR